jgi:transposase
MWSWSSCQGISSVQDLVNSELRALNPSEITIRQWTYMGQYVTITAQKLIFPLHKFQGPRICYFYYSKRHWHDFELFPSSLKIKYTVHRFESTLLSSSGKVKNWRKHWQSVRTQVYDSYIKRQIIQISKINSIYSFGWLYLAFGLK